MAQEWAKKFYNSAAWKRQRDFVLKRDRYICTEPQCRRRAEEVHHIIELNSKNVNDINVSLNPANLRSLCSACHKRITKEMHSTQSFNAPNIMFDAEGYPIIQETTPRGRSENLSWQQTDSAHLCN